MSTAFGSRDTASKGWLAALALALLISIVIVVRSFVSAFSTPDQVNLPAQQAAQVPSSSMVTVDTSAEPEWSTPSPASTTVPKHIPPVKREEFTSPKQAAAIRQAMVHQQAQNLRAMVKQNRLPRSFGHLTLEQIDEMEKNGIVIE